MSSSSFSASFSLPAAALGHSTVTPSNDTESERVRAFKATALAAMNANIAAVLAIAEKKFGPLPSDDAPDSDGDTKGAVRAPVAAHETALVVYDFDSTLSELHVANLLHRGLQSATGEPLDPAVAATWDEASRHVASTCVRDQKAPFDPALLAQATSFFVHAFGGAARVGELQRHLRRLQEREVERAVASLNSHDIVMAALVAVGVDPRTAFAEYHAKCGEVGYDGYWAHWRNTTRTLRYHSDDPELYAGCDRPCQRCRKRALLAGMIEERRRRRRRDTVGAKPARPPSPIESRRLVCWLENSPELIAPLSSGSPPPPSSPSSSSTSPPSTTPVAEAPLLGVVYVDDDVTDYDAAHELGIATVDIAPDAASGRIRGVHAVDTDAVEWLATTPRRCVQLARHQLEASRRKVEEARTERRACEPERDDKTADERRRQHNVDEVRAAMAVLKLEREAAKIARQPTSASTPASGVH